MSINVNNEIGKLKKVLLHRPYKELLNLVPDVLEELLFDDIPGYYESKKEHDEFAKIFAENGVEVVYLEELVSESILNERIKKEFIEQYLLESNVKEEYYGIVRDYLFNLEVKDMILTTMSGITFDELENKNILIKKSKAIYVIYPMPNLYFTRDSFSSIGNSVSINHMKSDTRNRETIYGHFIFKYHPDYKDTNKLYTRNGKYSIEGGDILVINKELIIIGNSQRTDHEAIMELSENIFNSNSDIKNIIEIKIDKKRAFMHLDTVMTQIDKNTFLVYPEMLRKIRGNIISKSDGKVSMESFSGDFENILKKYMNEDKIKFIYCGGNDIIASKREQWSDGSNVVAIEPGKVVAYKRNFVTNELLRKNGYEVIELDSSNLSMGRGGPRCMTMPLYREDI